MRLQECITHCEDKIKETEDCKCKQDHEALLMYLTFLQDICIKDEVYMALLGIVEMTCNLDIHPSEITKMINRTIK